ncbi:MULTISPECIES: hypothetical protein [unclassified Streptomyces]|uniref:hypothetical protein n=1 Tax=unclassified Streptomyces TaxID=2593676 RepID=UPI0003A29416|nr:MULTISPECIES: hypothetical protein [unclassified Streptomyces]
MEVGQHQEDVLGVLLVVLAGSAGPAPGDGAEPLTPTLTTTIRLPRASCRCLTAWPA